MNILNLLISGSYANFDWKYKNSSCSNPFSYATSLEKDTFVKETVLSQTQSSSFCSKQDLINRLFKDTYFEVISDISQTNPIISKLNLPFPKIVFQDKKTMMENANKDILACYDFSDNRIILPSDFEEDVYFLFSKGENGEIKRFGTTSAENLDDELQSLKKDYPNVEALTLTPDEKYFDLKMTIAHELRHYIQAHLIASTQDCADRQKTDYSNVYMPTLTTQQNYIAACKREGNEPNPMFANYSVPTYWQQYTPKEILDRNTLFKFSSNENDNRYWSVFDDFYSLTKELINSKYSDETYYGRPNEIDAYNYQLEYMDKFKSNKVRPEIFAYMKDEIQERINLGFNVLSKRGHNLIRS